MKRLNQMSPLAKPPASPQNEAVQAAVPRKSRTVWERLGGGALSFAIVFHILLFVLGALWVFQIIQVPDKNVDFMPSGGGGGERGTDAKIQQKKQAQVIPTSNVKRVFAEGVTSNFSIPEQGDSFAEMSPLSSLSGGGLSGGLGGSGLGKGFGAGSGDGAGSALNGAGMGKLFGLFGSSDKNSGGLAGDLYDLKKDPKEKPLSMNMQLYSTQVLDIQEGFSEAELKKYFRAPTNLFLTQLAIPLKDASEGPKSFEAQDLIKPEYWLVHYRGTVSVPRSGSYRFSGTGDNYLLLKIDGKTLMHYGNSPPKEWQTCPPTAESHQSPYTGGWYLNYGDWIDLRAGQKIKIDLAIGESGGGAMGFLLQVEEKGVKYRTDSKNKNRPILPLFTTVPFDAERRAKITQDFKSYEFEWEKVPVFSIGTQYSF